MSFKKDVVIDLVCYRRHGHNEADEPAATQPLMYAAIRKHPTLRQIYAETLEKDGVIGPNFAADLVKETRAKLDEGACLVKALIPSANLMNPVDWSVYLGKHWTEPCTTSLSASLFDELAKHISTVPENYPLHPRVAKMMEDRANMAAQKQPMDWGFAETMAYAGLLKQGYGLRLSGQDCGRGTFFHRHAVLHNQENGACHSPLASLATEHGPFAVIDSLLSEEAVLGFEYGYASAEPRSLVIWEAQFGDFANGAQVVIDQFISSGEQKWGRLCGLTLLLPHGYEGQGPEHSSARLERFLQLCAEENMQVCVPTTPAQVFHMLRRQAMRPVRKPLIVMSPKSLLRHRLAVSPAKALIEGHFELVIDEIDPNFAPKDIRRIVLCSGKVYYELLEKRESMGIKDIALIRVEQLYPFPEQALKQLLTKYPKASEIVWTQEEPQNQGAWLAIQEVLVRLLATEQTLRYAGRPASAAPAVGHFSMHQAQQDALIQSALA
jgi:2-oxoglutarate dehydrogenase E1 component